MYVLGAKMASYAKALDAFTHVCMYVCSMYVCMYVLILTEFLCVALAVLELIL